jgi:hypothetical protein
VPVPSQEINQPCIYLYGVSILPLSTILELFCGIFVFFILLSIFIVITFTLQASTFQIAVLLQFNSAESLSVQQLQDSTQIKLVRKMQTYISYY